MTEALLVATHNNGKLLELRGLLHALGFDLYSLNAFACIAQVQESGETFIENACLKATSYAQQTGMTALADDSGLEVNALMGKPGVHSARYAGEGASDLDRTMKLLSALSNVGPSERGARFVSAVAVASSSGVILNVSIGTCEGRIAEAPRGSRGFGYDPIFIPDGYNQTFGELPASVKNSISHRARALRQTLDFLRSLTMASRDG